MSNLFPHAMISCYLVRVFCWSPSRHVAPVSAGYSAPAVDYGLPGCEWIGYDTRSQSFSRDRAESVLAKDLIFPCNGTVLSVSAYVSGPCIYNFYVAAELPYVQFSPPATYFRVYGLATQVLFGNWSGMQTVSVSGMSFNQGDTILFERDRSRSLLGSIRTSSYWIGSFCLPKLPIAKLTSLYPTTGVNAVKIEQSTCTVANQYAIRLNIMTNNPRKSYNMDVCRLLQLHAVNCMYVQWVSPIACVFEMLLLLNAVIAIGNREV